MDTLNLGPIGITVDSSDGTANLDDATAFEKLGYSALWVAGGELASLNPLTELVRSTNTASVVPGIIPLDLHSAADVQQLYADLEATHPGRFVAGLGAPQTVPSPLSALSQSLDELDTAEPPVPVERRILAALGPRKLAVAAERFAGAVTLLVTPEYVRHARAALGPDAILVVTLLTVLDDSIERARSTARVPMEFLFGVDGYAANARRMGYADTDLTPVSDRLVDDLAAIGDATTIAARVREHLDAGANHVALSPLSEGSQAAPLEVAHELAGHLLP